MPKFLTDQEFENAAINVVIKVIDEEYGEQYDHSGIQMVWYAHILGHKKAILIDIGPDKRIYEVTYDSNRGFMYVDSYNKKHNREFSSSSLDCAAH